MSEERNLVKTIKFPNETPKKSIFFMETKKQQ